MMFLVKDLLKFDSVWQYYQNPHQTPSGALITSNNSILTTHYYAYAAFWICGQTQVAEDKAQI
jgi:hypothetical protein